MGGHPGYGVGKRLTDSWVDPLKILQLSTSNMTVGRRFVAVPSGTNRRWLFPSDSRSHAVASLALYQPRRFRARFAHTALRFGASLGALSFVPRQIRTDHQPWLEHWLSEVTGNADIRIALHVARNRRSLRTVTVAAVSRDRVEAVARISLTADGSEQVRREAEGLRLAHDLQIPVPSLLYHGALNLDAMGTTPVVVQGGVTGRTSSHEWSPSHDHIIATLEHGAPRPVNDSRLVRNLWEEVDSAPYLARYRPTLAKAMSTLGGWWHRPVLNHRDFAPWNLLETPSGALTPIDWEYSELDGVPYLDRLYFHIAVGILLRRCTPSAFASYIKSYGSTIGLPSDISRSLLSLLLIERIAWRHQQIVDLSYDVITEACDIALSRIARADHQAS